MVYLFLADGFEEIEALTPLDLLRRADIDVLTVSVSGNLSVVGGHGIKVTADTAIDSIDASIIPEMIILPGGLGGTNKMDSSDEVKKIITRAAEEKSYIAAICAAPMILGKMGLLRGRSAVCYPGFEKYLDGAQISANSKVVRDDYFITAKGMGVSLTFGLVLVEMLCGPEKAAELASQIQA